MKPSYKIALLFVYSMMLGCSNEIDGANHDLEKKTSALALICDSCIYDDFSINRLKSIEADTVFSTPIALGYFELYKSLESDSLHEKLKIDRQEYYRTYDRIGWFGHAKSTLSELKIPYKNGTFEKPHIAFMVDDSSFVIDVSYFKDNDGVILYTPGKQPILWEDKNMNIECDVMKLIQCYFKN